MPLPGGAADKAGNRYESAWTVIQLLRLLDDNAVSVRIEEPGLDAAEFVLKTHDGHEFHQLKRSNPNGKWSLKALSSKGDGVLSDIAECLIEPKESFVFVSGSDAPELRELSVRARESKDFAEYERRFLSDALKQSFGLVCKNWASHGPEDVYKMLKHVDVRTADEQNLLEQLNARLQVLFLADVTEVRAALKELVADSVHRVIRREDLLDFTAKRGYPLRRIANVSAAPAALADVTKRYLVKVRPKLIGGELINRDACRALATHLLDASTPIECILSGGAGTGKTACVIDLIERLQNEEINVLAFRLDRLEPTNNAANLGEQLGLEESPALVAAAAALFGRTVIILDQLDVVSTTSGRSLSFLDAVSELITEVRGSRTNHLLHLVVVCRTFDWQNDDRLRRMLLAEHHFVEISPLSQDELRTVLEGRGLSATDFSSRQLELLALPQNLSLYLDVYAETGTIQAFATQRELFDAYWRAKRKAVAARSGSHDDALWFNVISFMVNEMSNSQQLSIRLELLDSFDQRYIDQLLSEGVLSTFDGRCGFGHESFFDYCYARLFVRGNHDLLELLLASEQHLFRRAQVRQVLTYLREADPQRCSTHISALLTHPDVRFHIKDLLLAFLTNLPTPTSEELAIVVPAIRERMQDIENDRPSTAIVMTAWRAFWMSRSYFDYVIRSGIAEAWLKSEHCAVVNTCIQYLSVHQRGGEPVAALLEPYAQSGGEWPARLRHVVQWADLTKDRRFFELFLNLLSNGTLDDARGPIAVNSTFWDLLYELGKTRPEWMVEAISAWLRRRVAIILTDANGGNIDWRKLLPNEASGVQFIMDAARDAPAAFVAQMLPLVLEIGEKAKISDRSGPPFRDVVWSLFIAPDPTFHDDAVLFGLHHALQSQTRSNPGAVQQIFDQLRLLDTNVANYLLLGIVEAGGEHYSQKGTQILIDEPWRMECGYSGSDYWLARQAIAASCTYVDEQLLARLETVILGYFPEFERRHPKYRGRGSHELLFAFPPQLLSLGASKRFKELQRKFRRPPAAPRKIEAHWVGPPIDQKAIPHMDDAHWRAAIAKYESDEGIRNWEFPPKGGAIELSRELEKQAQEDPVRFGKLCLTLPRQSNPRYFGAILSGLQKSSADDELKYSALVHVFQIAPVECGRELADLLGSLRSACDSVLLEILHWLGTLHPDPEQDQWSDSNGKRVPYNGDMHFQGINTARGRTAIAIGNLLSRGAFTFIEIAPLLETVVCDHSLAVRSCLGNALIAVADSDESFALQLFLKLVNCDDRLLATREVQNFIYHFQREHSAVLGPVVIRMLRSPYEKVAELGAQFCALAALYGENVMELCDEALKGQSLQRRGMAKVVSHNIGHSECAEWCVEVLTQLMNDENDDVLQEVANCFRHLEERPLSEYESFISRFCESRAFAADSWSLLHALEESPYKLPDIACNVCAAFTSRFGAESGDIRTARYGDGMTVWTLLLRVYTQHLYDAWGRKALDIIDTMCKEGISEARGGLAEFER